MSKVIAIANQKVGTSKTTTTVNLAIGLAVQGNLTDSLGYRQPDNLPISLAAILSKTMMEESYEVNER